MTGIEDDFEEEFSVVENKKWFEELPNDPSDFEKVPEEIWIPLKDEAKKCNDSDALVYNIKCSKANSDYKWMKTAVTKGTLADRIAANVILIQDDPVCNLPAIHNIINMVKIGKKKECITAIDTITDLMLSDLLRPNVKLKPFYDRPHSKLDELSSGNSNLRRKFLSYWYFEDQLKEYYTGLVQAINTVAHDTVDANKEKALGAMHKLLMGNPEQEKNLLSNIVNKLGDPSHKVASKTIYCLSQVIYEHSNMKQVVLNEIERLLFRSNISPKAQYYGICFLTQFVLTIEDYNVAKNLIAVYFAFFKAFVKKNQIDCRMMSALLTGVNRAYPFAKSELNKIQEHIDTMYKVVHVSNFNVGVHGLNLLFQISNHNELNKDRFYTTVYRKLLDPEIATTKHQALFLNLIFRVLKQDSKLHRIKAFVKRLLQLALYVQPAMACGILYLIQQILRLKKHLLALKNLKSEDCDEDWIPLNEIIKENNMSDNDEEELKETEIVSSTLKHSNAIQINAMVIEKPELEIENLEDIVEEQEENELLGDIKIKNEYTHVKITNYSPLNRNPLYAGGKFCVYVELLNLQKHFHPTVALYASKIINAENIIYSGDPLKDFTLSKFLERFSFKNPKNAEQVQKKGINPIFGKRKLETSRGIKSFAVNSASYLNHGENNIPVEEKFMYKYLLQKHEDRKKINEDDTDSVASDEFEEMLDRMAGGVKMDEDLDFMNDVGESLNNLKKGKKNQDEDDSDDEDNSDEDSEDFSENDDFEDQESEENGDFGKDDFDNENDDDTKLYSDTDEDPNIKSKKNKKLMKKGKNKDDTNSLFASAEEFASILDEEDHFMAGTSHAVSNKDNANLKQISWEQSRDRWIKGYNKAVGKRNFNRKDNKFSNKSKIPFVNKRKKPQQGGNMKKNQKKY